MSHYNQNSYPDPHFQNANQPANRGEVNFPNNPKQENPLHAQMRNFLDHNATVTIMTIMNLYVLFGDDLRQLIESKSVDNAFFAITTICFIAFVLEIVLSLLARPNYFGSFFFLLDIISTIVLVFDIGWIKSVIFGKKASSLGPKTGRAVRVFQLMRLIRVVKLYKLANFILNTMKSCFKGNAKQSEYNQMKSSQFGQTTSQFQASNGFNTEGQGSYNGQNSYRMNSREQQSRRPNYTENDPYNQGGTSKYGNFLNPNDYTQMRNMGNKPGSAGYNDRPLSAAISVPIPKSNTNRSLPEPSKLESKLSMKPKEQNKTSVGKKLSELTTKRVIALFLIILISIPVFDVETYVYDFTSYESGLESLCQIYLTPDTVAFNLAVAAYINELVGARTRLITLDVGALGPQFQVDDEDALRDSEKSYYDCEDSGVDAYACFDQTSDTVLDALLGIGRTFFVTFVLSAAALYFSKDSNDLVLRPIESMLFKVKRIAESPLAAAQIEEEEALMHSKLEKEGNLKDLKKKKEESSHETVILEKTILKLGALLALGFGEAGSNIIAENMAKNGEIDPMIPGRKIMAIFGFCDIRQFTDATEVLQEGVMVFVNEIAEVVHGIINSFSGAANKNIGDAFLLVWKFSDEDIETDPRDPSNLRLKKNVRIGQMADMSVISFLKVLSGTNKSKKLDRYRHHEGLNKRIANYCVKMGFGLHVGWAIEGAIGSEYKIDASYLSPNVNFASKLEGSTKQYGIPVLISGDLQRICTEETQAHLRQVDRVVVGGNSEPVNLYTCDIDYQRIPVDRNEVDISSKSDIEKKQARVEKRLKRDSMKEKAFTGKYRVGKKFVTDPDLVAMRKPYTREFDDMWRQGMASYISGNWGRAKECFERTLRMLNTKDKDGPSNTLLNFMGETNFRPPSDWKGHRELRE